MKKWAFISDFDGTITNKDFYWMIIEKYYPEGEGLFHRWKNGELKDIEFLSTVFLSINQSEQEIIKTVHDIPLDPYAIPFIKKVQQNNGDFHILSAGTDYYIDRILKEHNLQNVEIYSNKGYYKENNIYLDINQNHWHYSERYGIDKSKVIQNLKKNYDHIFYFGDSEPDSHPAKYADTMFAKDALINILQEQNVPFTAVKDFSEVEQQLIRDGWLKA